METLLVLHLFYLLNNSQVYLLADRFGAWPSTGNRLPDFHLHQ